MIVHAKELIIVVASAAMFAMPAIMVAEQSKQSFETMTQPVGDQEECKVPKPPKDLNSFAYIRNGYREILRITSTEVALETEDCACPFQEIDWGDVVEASDRFVTSENPSPDYSPEQRF